MKGKTKYNSTRCEYDGHKFDSKEEFEFYCFLLKCKNKGDITDIVLQPRFELIPNYTYFGQKRRGITYTADFTVTSKTGNMITYDVKGFCTQQSAIRKKLFEYKYPDLKLVWIAKSIKYGTDGWIKYEDLKKIRANNKKEKSNG